VERIFKNSFEYCSEHDVWKLNVAHTYFMQSLSQVRIRHEPQALIL
jgi:hypothetical protein